VRAVKDSSSLLSLQFLRVRYSPGLLAFDNELMTWTARARAELGFRNCCPYTCFLLPLLFLFWQAQAFFSGCYGNQIEEGVSLEIKKGLFDFSGTQE
jgi:hypothetical protein